MNSQQGKHHKANPASRRLRTARIAAGVALLTAVLATGAVFLFRGADTTPNLGTNHQFVWDGRIIDYEKTTATLTQHTPVRQEIVFAVDSPWEGSVAEGFTIVDTDGGYWMYYSTYDTKDAVRVCLAQSSDGIHWEKPALHLVDYNGSTENNILFDADSGIANGFFVFRDANPAAKADETYKAVAVTENGLLVSYVSADGLHWKENDTLHKNSIAAIENSAALNSVFWSKEHKQYFCYYIAEENGRQKIAVTTSKNFKNWSKPKAITYTDGEPAYSLQTANLMSYYRGADMVVGLPLRAVTVDQAVIQTNFSGNTTTTETLTDTVFLSSTDGLRFDLTHEAWLTPGPQNGSNWVWGDTMTANGLVETESVHGDKGQDNDLSVYVAENTYSGSGTALARYTMRVDGFASYHAPYNTRKVVTKPVVFEGNRMTVNFSTSTDGYVYVRILDENGQPFESTAYTAEDGTEYSVPKYTSYKLIGDRVDREVVFNGDLSHLVGKTVVLEFYLSDAELYSFRFDNEPYQTDTEWQPEEIELRSHEEFRYEDTGEVLNIGTDRQLFWDNYIIDEANTNASLVSHSPVRKEELFRTDLPWEGDNCDFYVIVNDEDESGHAYYRMYYLGWDSSDFHDIRVCYAYSYDGINWTKPNLGKHTYTDKKTGIVYTETNIVMYTEEDIFDNFFVMKDTRPGVPASQRYKAICQGNYDQLGYSSYGLWAWVSADGINWKKVHRVVPQLDHWFGAFDSVNTLVWDEGSQQFFTYFRVREEQLADGIQYIEYRKIYGATGDSFAPFDTDTMFTLNYGEGAPLFEMYTNNITKYYRAPQVFIGFPTRFSRNTAWAKNYEYLTDPQIRLENYNGGQITRTLSMTDTMFMTSRDGYLWNRQNEAFITPGPEYQANWIYGNCYPAYGLVETAADQPGADNQISTYLFEGKFYTEPSVFCRYVMRLDGFTSYKGNYSGQTVTTKAFTFTGTELLLNFATSAAGSVTVNILDENGQPIEGYSSGKLVGDNTDRTVVFENDLAALNGRPVVLQFVLQDAEIYSFKFQ